MSRPAEVERERRARVITADGEFQTAQQLACASRIMADTSEVIQLRLFQTVVEVAAEKHSTLVMPFLWNCCGYFDRAARRSGTGSDVETLVPAPHDETVPALARHAVRGPSGSAAPASGIRQRTVIAGALGPSMRSGPEVGKEW